MSRGRVSTREGSVDFKCIERSVAEMSETDRAGKLKVESVPNDPSTEITDRVRAVVDFRDPVHREVLRGLGGSAVWGDGELRDAVVRLRGAAAREGSKYGDKIVRATTAMLDQDQEPSGEETDPKGQLDALVRAIVPPLDRWRELPGTKNSKAPVGELATELATFALAMRASKYDVVNHVSLVLARATYVAGASVDRDAINKAIKLVRVPKMLAKEFLVAAGWPRKPEADNAINAANSMKQSRDKARATKG